MWTKTEQSFKSVLVLKGHLIIRENRDELPFCTLDTFLDEQCWSSEFEGSHSDTCLGSTSILCKFTKAPSICEAALPWT